MNKKILLLGVAVLAVLSLVFLFKTIGKDEMVDNKQANQQENLKNAANQPREPYDPLKDHPISFYNQKAEDVFGGEKFLSYEEIIQKAKNGEIHLVWELWAVRRKCPKEYRPQQCDLLIRGMLEKKYPPPGNQELLTLFDDYRKYEDEMRTFDKVAREQKLKFKDKYAAIKKKRREILGDENAKMVFGMEEAKVQFAQSQKTFLTEHKDLPAEEKLQKFEELKKNIYGDYYQTVKNREQKYDTYQTELMIRKQELAKLDGKQKETKLQEIEERIFGKEIAGKLAENRKQFALEDQKLKEYQKKEQEFLSQNSGLSDEQKQKKLTEIQIEVLGEQGANSYQKRMELENALKAGGR